MSGLSNAEALSDRERRRQRRHGRMREQPEDAVGRRRKLRVVVVHRVPARAVGERRLRRGRRPRRGSEHGGLVRASVKLGIDQVDLEERQAVGHHLRRARREGHAITSWSVIDKCTVPTKV